MSALQAIYVDVNKFGDPLACHGKWLERNNAV